MKTHRALSLLALAGFTRAHGGHGPEDGENMAIYAARHMATEHHIETFDLASFFHLHDLNRDGYWDKEEIEAVYGVHHIYNKQKSKDDEEHQAKADQIVNTVLSIVDKDHDGKVSQAELEAAGLAALPSFAGTEGHHYDVESEFFLHHEEQFHNTPETQTDESYVHPEDIAHFAAHEEIERKEAEKEAKFQGVSVEDVLKQHEHDGETIPKPSQAGQVPLGEGAGGVPHPHDDLPSASPVGQKPSAPDYTRAAAADPIAAFRNAKKQSQAQEEWGEGSAGYKAPKTPAEKLRKNVPYKERMQYKFKRSWGDF